MQLLRSKLNNIIFIIIIIQKGLALRGFFYVHRNGYNGYFVITPHRG
nr:MAG TPA: hypothetical protein [Caudoviricetes sp.]